jgi:hypothetical protein
MTRNKLMIALLISGTFIALALWHGVPNETMETILVLIGSACFAVPILVRAYDVLVGMAIAERDDDAKL